MKAIKHPSAWLDKKIADAIRSKAHEAESLQQLHPDQLALIHKERWLKIFVPKKFGGLGLTLPEALRLEEALAWTDGSLAWVVTLCTGAAWFVGFLDSDLTSEIFSGDTPFFAGSGASTGTAKVLQEGYLLNGKWKYASGALHATIFTANFAIYENGKARQKNNAPTIRAFVMKKDEVTIHQTWSSIGMVATASHSFEVKNLVVDKNRAFGIDPNKVVINKPIYHYPFLQLAETTLSVNLSGLAVRFIDLFEETIIKKSSSTHHSKFARTARKKLNAQRSKFYNAVNLSWKSCSQKRTVTKSELKKVSEASQTLAQQSIFTVDELYLYCGLTAADRNQEINLVWRNIHTASQHSLFKR